MEFDFGTVYEECDLTNISYEVTVNTSRSNENTSLPQPAATSTPVKPRSTHQCDECDFETTKASVLRRHKDTVHLQGGTPFECKTCLKKFKRKDYLLEHQKRHSNMISHYICSKCGVSYSSRQGLFYHTKKHDGKLKYKCNECNISFYTKDHFLGHVNKNHHKVQPFQCSKCNKAFHNPALKRSHEQQCGNDNKLTCGHCGVEVSSKRVLKDHVQGKHGSNTFLCPCGASYMWRQSFLRHRSKCLLAAAVNTPTVE